jgi:hypothetical protein
MPRRSSKAGQHSGAGRPSRYKPEYAGLAAKLCELGATDEDIAEAFGVALRSIYRWKAEYPEFCHALKVGKGKPDDRVERSLYLRAVGYSYDATKIAVYRGRSVIVPYREHVPPDTTAAIFWLKNRRADEWREVAKPRDKPVGMPLPKIEAASDLNLAASALVDAVANGVVTLLEAQAIADLIEFRRKVLEAVDHEARLVAVEAAVRAAQSK